MNSEQLTTLLEIKSYKTFLSMTVHFTKIQFGFYFPLAAAALDCLTILR